VQATENFSLDTDRVIRSFQIRVPAPSGTSNRLADAWGAYLARLG